MPYETQEFNGTANERVKTITIHNPDGQPYHASIEWQYKVETPVGMLYPHKKTVSVVMDETNELHQRVMTAMLELAESTKDM